MVLLRRTVRFAINDPCFGGEKNALDPNGFGGQPAMRGLGRHYELDLTCRGVPDPATGYLLNIKDLDAVARTRALPLIARACAERPHTEPADFMPEMWRALSGALGGTLASLRWRLTPTYAVEMTATAADRVTLRQQFDFSAAHRLHSPALDEAENRRLFGKCNNPSGHGHNYRVEPAVSIVLSATGRFTLADLEGCVERSVIAHFDHKHLNLDTPEFAPAGGLIPSVENIARRCFELLAPEVTVSSGSAARLDAVTVWETDRTSCTYPG